ncbi:SDR family NAD(P)-dependent oxidoreductase [Dactylosporangium sp. CS-047395]|uniref:SDR family NAD(P)-dependent oxidoreductase n=1 Tax=Dactylosporangium sp. CS-047395 TaxID=3239936 RepID=UPI003D93E70C
MAAAGHRVLIAGRSAERRERTAEMIGAHPLTADFGHLEQVRDLAVRARAALAGRGLDVLINNVRGLFRSYALTPGGHETTFQVNHLASFLLTSLLLAEVQSAHGTVINTVTADGRQGLRRVAVDELGRLQPY